jgi:hypothetical protein
VPVELWLVQVALAWFLSGLIWTIQIVHYPLFKEVGADSFARYATGHGARITPLVFPTMIAELVLAVWTVLDPPAGVSSLLAGAGLALVAVIWISTGLLQVPAHTALQSGFQAAAHRRLLVGNWVRTAAWTARAIVLLFCFSPSLAAK